MINIRPKWTSGSSRLIRLLSGCAISAACVLTPSAMSWAGKAESCDGLRTLSLADTTITAAELVSGGTFQPASGTPITRLPDFCRIAGTSSPTPTSKINFEVWLPVSGWNGKYQQVGNGGLAGSIQYAAMTPPLQQGYATSSTDDGTAPSGQTDWLNDIEKVKDWGYRAVHETAQNGRAIVEAFYNRPAQFAYFSGCSKGGHEAMMELQRFPEDFDGIVGGDPASDLTHLLAQQLWNPRALLDDSGGLIPQNKLTLLHNAVLSSCIGLDKGLSTDGFLNDPRDCHFDPAVLQCSGADTPDCLTAGQVAALNEIYQGPRNPRTHEQIFPGMPRGGEAPPGNLLGGLVHGWQTYNGLQLLFPQPVLGITVFHDPNWDWTTFDFDADMTKVDEMLAPILNATDPNIAPFKSHGGKLIIYSGWDDPFYSGYRHVNYYKAIARLFGARATQQFARLFMVPGMGHCTDGPGPNTFDPVAALANWVEHGVAPAQIVATKHQDNDTTKPVEMTRPLCPFPQIAVYDGTGSTTDAGNFKCIVDKDLRAQN